MFLQVVISALVLASVISAIRVIIGPSLWDRLLGLSLVCSKIIIIIIMYSLIEGQSFYLDIALIIAMLGFVGTTTISTFLKKNKKL